MSVKTWFFIYFALIGLSPKAFSQGGNTCSSASSSQLSLPFNLNNQSTCGDGNDYTGANGCLPSSWGNPYGGADWLYAFTPNANGFINILLDDIQASSTAYPTLSLYEACPGTPNSCLASVQGSSWNNSGTSLVFPVQSGTLYYIGIDAFTISNYYANCFQFDLEASLITIPVQPGCTNMNFSSGNLNGWIASTGTAATGPVGAPTPSYNITNIGVVNGRHTIMTGGNDPCGGFPRVDPQGGPTSVRLGNNTTGAQAEQLRQTFMVSPSNSSFTYRYAVVFQDPGHSAREQPFFRALLKDANGNVIPCSDFVVSAAANLPGFFSCQGNVRYKPWSTVNVDLSNYLGQAVTVEFTAGDCSQGGHYGYAYIDAKCEPSTLAALADTICPGESVTLTAPDGYASYSWQPGNVNSQSITVSPTVSTTYTLNLTAFNGCSSTFQVPITVAINPVASFTYQAPACDLPVQLQANNLTSGSSYLWNIGPAGNPATASQATVNASFPGPGSYPVTLNLTSEFGCSDTITQNVTVPPCVFRIAITGDTICSGECINFPVSMNYGVAPYTFSWSTGSSDSTITICSSQDQLVSLTVTDADGFVATDTAMITISEDVIFNNQLVNLSCFQSQNGSIEVNPVGWGPFTYLWSQGAIIPTISSLSADTYSVQITDRFGCTSDTSFIVTQPDELSFQTEIIEATCNLPNAILEIIQTTGGTPDYSYSMNGTAQTTQSVFSSLSPGTYTVYVSDANSCVDSILITINSITYPTLVDLQTTHATCSFANGSIQVNGIEGGISPYSVSFNGSPAEIVTFPFTIDSLPENLYQVSLIDSNGCIIDTTAGILQFEGPSGIQFSIVDGTCDLSNGSVTIDSVFSGVSPIEISFNNENFASVSSFNELSPGIYSISVRDSNLCILDTSATISSIPPVLVNAHINANPSCFGFNNGEAHAEILQGTYPISFSWDNGVNDSLISGLTAGIYIVTASDANACEHKDTIQIIQPEVLQFSIFEQNPSCGNNNGLIEIDSTFGGTAPYSYRLNSSNWSSSALYNSLYDGSYTIYVRDNNQCSDSVIVQLSTPSFPTEITTAIVDAVCDENNAQIQIQAINGGSGALYIAFNTDSFIEADDFPIYFNQLVEGQYTIHVKDENDCQIDSILNIIRYPGPNLINASIVDATCSQNNASIEIISVQSGTAPFQYAINNSSYAADTLFSNLAPGSYSISVIDSNNCILDSILQTVAIPDVSIVTILEEPIRCFGFADGAVMAQIPSGIPPFVISWNNGASGALNDSLIAGVYTATVIDSNGCTANSSIALTQPQQIQIDITAPDYVCEGSEVMLQAAASGGSGHLDVTWPAFSHSSEVLLDTPDTTTTYVAMATDILGCHDIDSTSILLRLNPNGLIVPDVSEGCSPVCVNFSFNSMSSANINHFEWTFEESYHAEGNSPNHCFSSFGSQDVSVLLEDEFGCKAIITESNAIEVHPLPQARFSYTPDKADVMEPVIQFLNESDLADYFNWTFGDGFFSLLENPEHEYSDTGSYEVCLKVSTVFGCEDFACKMLDIDPFPTIFAPNAFTPNQDGTNDVFLIKLTYVDQFLLEIFDRWGELIFSSTNPYEGWDGNYKGKPTQEDVYVWRVTYTNMLKKHNQLIGKVTLIR